jgi:alpha-1,2-mannosyltransferase
MSGTGPPASLAPIDVARDARGAGVSAKPKGGYFRRFAAESGRDAGPTEEQVFDTLSRVPLPSSSHGRVPLRRGLPLAVLWALGAVYLVLVFRNNVIAPASPNDFAGFYAASRLVLSGHAADVFDQARLFAAQQSEFGGHVRMPWAYPPVYLLFVAGLALLSYGQALAVWLAATTVPVVLLIRRIARLPLAVTAVLPAIAHNVSVGQNGALTAGLLLGGVVALDRRRSWLAGLLFGLTVYKPQICLLIPVCLLAGGHWLALAAMALAAAALCAGSVLCFGTEIWARFFANLPDHMQLVTAGLLQQDRFPTVFVGVLKLTGRADVAQAVQAVATLLVMAAVWWVWRRRRDLFARVLVLAAAMPLVTPFLLEYDLVLAAAPAAFLFRRVWDGEARPVDYPALPILWVLSPAIWAASLAGWGIGLVPALALMGYALHVGARGQAEVPPHLFQ